MNDFEYDSYIKKRIARGAINRKSGSKSRKCSLPSDRMTQKQWKERNGKIMSYNLSQPMLWEEFKSMPKDLQIEYLTTLRDTYGVTATDLSKLFGCVPSTVTKYCKAVLNTTFDPGKRMTREQRKAFCEFTGEITAENDDTGAIVEEETPAPDRELLTSQGCSSDAPTKLTSLLDTQSSFNMKEISMSFSGGFNADALRNSLLLSIGTGTPVHIDIKCTIIS